MREIEFSVLYFKDSHSVHTFPGLGWRSGLMCTSNVVSPFRKENKEYVMIFYSPPKLFLGRS